MNYPALGFLLAPNAAAPMANAVDHAAELTLWEMLKSGGWVMLPLMASSVVVVGIIVYCFLSLRQKLIMNPELQQGLDTHLEKEDLAGLAKYLTDRPEAVAIVLSRVLQFSYRRKDADGEAIKAVAEAEGGRLAAQFNQRAVYLLDIGALAPMLGLFGTVVGILRSFGSIAAEPSPMRTMLLAGGVSQALVATAAGLIVGITAMFFYSYFRGRVQHLVSIFETETTARVQELILLTKRTSGK